MKKKVLFLFLAFLSFSSFFLNTSFAQICPEWQAVIEWSCQLVENHIKYFINVYNIHVKHKTDYIQLLWMFKEEYQRNPEMLSAVYKDLQKLNSKNSKNLTSNFDLIVWLRDIIGEALWYTSSKALECLSWQILENWKCVDQTCSEWTVKNWNECVSIDVKLSFKQIWWDKILITNWQSQATYEVFATYQNKKIWLEPTVWYSTNKEKWTIKVSEKNGVYIITYKTANITGDDIQNQKDILYFFYQDPISSSRKYLTQEIGLSTTKNLGFTIEKPWFQIQTITQQTSSSQLEFLIKTKWKDNQMIPVNWVLVSYNQIFDAVSDDSWLAYLSLSDEISDPQNIEVLLELDPKIVEAKKDAFNIYEDLLQKNNLNRNEVLTDFIVNFPYHISLEKNETQAKKMVAYMLRLPTALWLLRQSNKTAEDASIQIAWSWKNLITDLYDMASSFDSFSKRIEKWQEKAKWVVKYEEIMKKLVEKVSLAWGYLSDIYKKYEKQIENKVWPEILEYFVKDVKEQFTEKILEKYKVYLLLKWKETSVEDLENFFTEVKNKVLWENFASDSFENWIKDWYLKDHYKKHEEIIKHISLLSTEKKYSDYSALDIWIENAKQMYSDFVWWTYNLKHEAQYNISFFKDSSDFLTEVLEFKWLGTGVSETDLIKKTTEVFAWAVKALKIFDTMIDGVLIYHWYDAFFANQDIVKKSALQAMDVQIKYSQNQNFEKNIAFILAENVYADDELAFLKDLYQNKEKFSDWQRDVLLEFTKLSIEIDFLDTVLLITKVFDEVQPNDLIVQKYLNEFNLARENAIQKYKNLEDEIDNMKVVAVWATTELVYLLWTFLVLSPFILLRIVFRKRKVIKTICKIIILFIVILSIGAYIYERYQDKKTILIPQERDLEQKIEISESDKNSYDSLSTSMFLNKKFGFQFDAWKITSELIELEVNERYLKAWFVYCLPISDKKYLDNSCGDGKVNLFTIEVYDEQTYNAEIKNPSFEDKSDFGYSLVWNQGDNYFVLSHPNWEFPDEVWEKIWETFYQNLAQSFKLK